MYKKVMNIIEGYLMDNKLDGLTSMEHPNVEDCCCDVDNLFCWCEGEDVLNCYPGKKEVIDSGDEENDQDCWMIIPHFKKDE